MNSLVVAVCLTALAIFYGGYARDYMVEHEKRLELERQIKMAEAMTQFEFARKWQPPQAPQPQQPSIEIQPNKL